MVAWRSKFDGEKIETPPELRGAAPGEVLIIYPTNEGSAGEVGAPVVGGENRPSIWDVFGKAAAQRSAAEINASVRADRDSWGQR
jgi:hypothetical protein